MRIWSLHPEYLDAKGLVALWRETLLAKNVLEGKTKGYLNHPQLTRFKNSKSPLDAINYYLESVWKEADGRAYNFDKAKFSDIGDIEKINLTTGQLDFEIEHLLKKLERRDPEKYFENLKVVEYKIHPLFKIVEGDIEPWEKL